MPKMSYLPLIEEKLFLMYFYRKYICNLRYHPNLVEIAQIPFTKFTFKVEKYFNFSVRFCGHIGEGKNSIAVQSLDVAT